MFRHAILGGCPACLIPAFIARASLKRRSRRGGLCEKSRAYSRVHRAGLIEAPQEEGAFQAYDKLIPAFIARASLKHSQSIGPVVNLALIPAFIARASLKQSVLVSIGGVVPAYSRVHRAGLIEAKTGGNSLSAQDILIPAFIARASLKRVLRTWQRVEPEVLFPRSSRGPH